MTPERWQKVKQLLDRTLAIEPGGRAAFLNEACGGDIELKKEIEALMTYDSKVDNFLAVPAFDAANLNPAELLTLVSNEDQDSDTQRGALIGAVLDDKYLIEKRLGQGGMGAVYLATHIGTKRKVALKLINPQLSSNPEFVERFKREAEATGRLHHPNVVNVTDFGFTKLAAEHVAFLVMEYLDGLTLGDLLGKRGRLPLAFVVDIVEQVSLALDKAHQQGIIHRDLKPDNIWLESNGRGGYNVKILDFGLAKLRDTHAVAVNGATAATAINGSASLLAAAKTLLVAATNEKSSVLLDSGMTRAGTILGTPLYMSPEQCQSATLDARSDIYSLGVIIYQMLSGETPFTGDLYRLIIKHCEAAPTQLKEKRRDIPSAVNDLIMSMLAKDRARRPETVTAVAIALRLNADGERAILQHALSLFQQRPFEFIKISLRSFAPFICFYYLLITALAVFAQSPYSPYALNSVLKGAILLLLPVITLFGHSVATAVMGGLLPGIISDKGVAADAVIFKVYKRIIQLVITGLASKILLPLKVFKRGGGHIEEFAGHSFYPLIVALEGNAPLAALGRSEKLLSKIRPVAIGIQIRKAFLVSLALICALCALLLISFITDIALPGIVYDFNNKHTDFTVQLFIPLVVTAASWLVMILAGPIISIAQVILYEKALQINGERPAATVYQSTAGNSHGSFVYKRSLALLLLNLIMLAGFFSSLPYQLQFAAKNGYVLLTYVLVKTGVDPNVQVTDFFPRRYSSTPLIEAAANGQGDTVKLLLDNNADINGLDSMGATPLIMAIVAKDPFLVLLLLEKGADPNIKCYVWGSPLTLAAGSTLSSIPITEMLLNAGANVNDKVDPGSTPLKQALHADNYELVSILIRRGANINDSYNGETPLMVAARSLKPMFVKLLIEKGALVDARDRSGQTALLHTIAGNRTSKDERVLEIVNLLIEAGAHVNIKDNSGDSALTLAQRFNFEPLADLLTMAGAKGATANLATDSSIPTDLAGEWVNIDPETDTLTRIHLSIQGRLVKVRIWGRCHPDDCDWDEVIAKPYNFYESRPVRATAKYVPVKLMAAFISSWSEKQVIIDRIGRAKLRVEIFNSYPRASKRTNFAVADIILRKKSLNHRDTENN